MKNKWKIINRTFLLSITIFILLNIAQTVSAEEVQFKAGNINQKYIEWSELPDEERDNTIAPSLTVKNIETNQLINRRALVNNLGASVKYNLRDTINLKIKNQKNTDFCWAFSTTTQLESYMAKIKNKSVEYSPRHIEYGTIREYTDEVNPYGFNRRINGGGNCAIAYAYLANGQGPVLESDMPFTEDTSNISINEIKNKKAQMQLKEYVLFPEVYKEVVNNQVVYYNGQTGEGRKDYTQVQILDLRNQVKNHIINYGAVAGLTATGAYQFFSNSEQPISSNAYFCDDSTIVADHQITIIGWDDTYSVNNFNPEHRPKSPGAWLVQNSYGTEITDDKGNVYPVHNNGLLYISYEDFIIDQALAGIIRMDEIDYDNIYQYSPLGANFVITSFEGSVMYCANVFKKENNNEYLSEISFNTSGLKSYTYEIYVNCKNGTMQEKNLTKVKTISNTSSDYITAKLEKPMKIEGDEFTVVVKFINNDGYPEVPVEARAINVFLFPYWATASSNEGESFVSTDGDSWYDLKSIYISGMSNMNACIKAFTKNIIEDPIEYDITSKKYTIDNDKKTITHVSPDTKNSEFCKSIITEGNIEILDKNGKKVESTSIIATGMKLKLNETEEIFDIVVTGDVNGDGKVSVTDLLKVKRHIVGISRLSGLAKIACDVNYSNDITTTDVMQIKQVICKLKSF